MSEQTTASKTHTDSAHLLRAIERGIVYDRLPAPIAVNMQPEYGVATVRLADDDMPGVQAWAALIGATVAHSTITHDEPEKPWHQFGTDDGASGTLAGWKVNLWCAATGSAPELCPCIAEPEPAAVDAQAGA